LISDPLPYTATSGVSSTVVTCAVLELPVTQ
jgi:hypothetical protein